MEFNIYVNIKEIIWGVVDWIHVTQDRDQGKALTVVELRVPLNVGEFLRSWTTVGF